MVCRIRSGCRTHTGAAVTTPGRLTGMMSVAPSGSRSGRPAGPMVAAAFHADGPSATVSAVVPATVSAVVPAAVSAMVPAAVSAAGIDRGCRHGQGGQGQDRDAPHLHHVFT